MFNHEEFAILMEIARQLYGEGATGLCRRVRA